MKIEIKHLNGSLGGKVDEFPKLPIKIGRASSSDLMLIDDNGLHRLASRLHAEIRQEGRNFILYDLESRNGTFVNGQPILKKSLKDGDEFSFGQNGLTFMIKFKIDLAEEATILRLSPLFTEIPIEILTRIYSQCSVVQYQPGAVLLDSAQIPDKLMFLKAGKVELQYYNPDDTYFSNYVEASYVLVDLEALFEEPLGFRVIVAEESEFVTLDVGRLKSQIRNSAELAEFFFLSYARLIAKNTRRIA